MKLGVNEMINTYEKYTQLQKQHFYDNVLFSTQWWILLFITVALWAIWGIIVDKRRMNVILLVGLITSVIALILDDIGTSFALWMYPFNLLPSISHLYTVDIVIVPVSYMLLFQYAKTWLTYSVFLVLLSLFAVLIAEPIFVKLDIFIPLQWKLLYAAPIYVVIGVFVKWFVDRMEKKYA